MNGQTGGMEAVRTRFDRVAADWDANPARIALARAVVSAIREAVPPVPGMHAMDFGAGTGLVTLGLLPYVERFTAVDASPEMLRVLSEKLNTLGIANVRTLLNESAGTPLPQGEFDLVVSSMVLHHLPDVPATLRRLRHCLRPGGWIAVADLDTEDGSFHTDRTGVYHNGLSRDTVCGWLRDAGFTDLQARQAHCIQRPAADGATRDYPVFLINGRAV